MLRAVQVIAGRVTAIDRDARTLSLGSMTFRLPNSLSLTGIDVGTSVSVVYEDLAGVLTAVQLRPWYYTT